MGQAKRRGTFQERLAAAVARRQAEALVRAQLREAVPPKPAARLPLIAALASTWCGLPFFAFNRSKP